MEKQAKKRTLAYIIDSDFKIVFSNSELKHIIPEAKLGQHCYEIFGEEHCQCPNCPLRSENDGKSILFDHLRNDWVSVTTAPVDIPGLGSCHMVINDSVENSSRVFLYDAAGKSDYAELLELNYLHDRYYVAYHGERKNPNAAISGSIRQMVQQLARRIIHPDDRERFYDFWLLDRVGAPGLPEPIFTPRHGEFRRRRADGEYDWVQQVFLPVRQSSANEIFVNNFFNIIDMPSSPEDRSAPVTGHTLLPKDGFFHRAEQLLEAADPDQEWSIIAIDVERLKLFNEWYGRQAGDTLLAGITECLRSFQDGKSRIAGHFYDDDYAVMMPHDDQLVRRLYEAVSSQIKKSSDKMNILPAFGVYTVTGRQESVFSMYDRAKLACSSVKGNFTDRIKVFDNGMLERLQADYLLLSDIQKAFLNHEFTFYLQPKCKTESGKIAGAEALARWYNPEKGMISPGIFVPFLEKSGLISELDTYIWEEVCKWQRSILDRGLPVVPISVNVSRIDIYAVDVPAYFQNLIQKYDLSPSVLDIEITESAYAEDTNTIIQVVRSLRNAGFCVLMDDFGSAYSSLNMLKDVEVDVLKIDMRFLDFDGEHDHRAINIVETVCHMAHLLGLKIVAEGVETQPQQEMLLKAGCAFSQGYYFYRPLSIESFEELLSDPEKLDREDKAQKQDAVFELKDLMLQNVFSLNMLDNVVGAMAFYDVCGEDISLVRFNEKYAALFGDDGSTTELDLHFGKQLYDDEYKNIFHMFDQARQHVTTGAETDLRRRKSDGTDIWINMRIFFLYQRNGHDVFYSTVRDVTKVHKSNEVLRFLNNDMPGGYYRHLDDRDCTFTHISQRFLDIFGYTRQEIRELFDDKFINMFHPDDRQAVWASMAAMEQTGGNYTLPCRMQSKNGYISILDQSRLVEYKDQIIFQGIVLHDLDHYDFSNDDDRTTLTSLMPCGFFQSEVDGDHRFNYVSSSLLQMLGYSQKQFKEKFKNTTENLIYWEDRKRLDEEVLQQISQSNFVSCEYRVEMVDGSLKWVYSRARMTIDRSGKRWFNVCIIDHDYLREKYEIQNWQYLKYKSLSSMPGAIVFDYDPATDCLNVEMTSPSGEHHTVAADHYVENIENGDIISPEHALEQKRLLLHASVHPGTFTSEIRARFTPGGSFRWYRFRYNALADEMGHVYRIIGHGTDISTEKLTITTLTHRAAKDSLTGLLNYEAAKEKADDLLRRQGSGMLFLLDIDNFKQINDTQGHLVGDKLLKMLAGIIHTVFRKEGITARFGGDEFLVFVPGLTDRKKAEQLIQRLLKATARVQFADQDWLKCSIGIAQRNAASHEIPFETLFLQADAALYHSKRTGKNKYTFYTDDLHGILPLR